MIVTLCTEITMDLLAHHNRTLNNMKTEIKTGLAKLL